MKHTTRFAVLYSYFYLNEATQPIAIIKFVDPKFIMMIEIFTIAQLIQCFFVSLLLAAFMNGLKDSMGLSGLASKVLWEIRGSLSFASTTDFH